MIRLYTRRYKNKFHAKNYKQKIAPTRVKTPPQIEAIWKNGRMEEDQRR